MKGIKSIVSFLFLCISGTIAILKSCQDPITCYLESVTINIPDFCVDELGICINDFVCNGLFIGGIPSSYLPPTTLGVGVSGLGTACAFSYQYNRLIKGDVTASIMDTSLDIDLLVTRDDNGYYPIATSFSYCNLTSMDIDITFSSSGLDYLAPILEKAIKGMVNQLACVKLADFFAVNVTDALVTTVDPLLAEIIASQPSPLPQYDPFYYISWEDSLVSTVHKIVDQVSGLATGGDFLQCMVNESPTLIHDLLQTETRKLLQDEHYNKIHIDMRPYKLTATKMLPNVQPPMDSSVTLTSLTITGFDTMTEFDLLDPMTESNVTLHTYMGFEFIKIEVGLDFSVTTVNGDGETVTYQEELLATFHVTDAYVLADLVVAVNQFLLNSYFLDQLATPACWLSALTEVSLANLQLHMSIEELSLVQVSGSAGPLEQDIVNLLDNAFDLLVDGFGPLITDTVNGLFQGPIRLGINDKLASSIAQSKADSPCLTHYPYSDQHNWIEWSKSSLISVIDLIVNEKVGPAGVNKMMNCLTNYTGVLVLNTTHLKVDVSGLNSFYQLKVLAPADDAVANPYDLVNDIAMGYCPSIGAPDCNPLKLMIASYNTESDDANDIWAQAVNAVVRAFKIEMSLENLDIFLDILLKLDKNGLKDLTFGQTSTNGCKQSTMEQFAVEAFKIGLSNADVSINDGQHYRNITYMVDKVLSALTRQEKVDARNTEMSYTLSVAEDTCKADGVSPDATTDDTAASESVDKNNEWKWEIAVVALGSFTALLILLWAYNYWGNARQLSCMAVEKTEGGISEAVLDERSLWEKWNMDASLVCEAKVPLWLRIAVPVVILGNMGLFLNSNNIPDAVSVMVEIDAGDQPPVTPDSVFDFGLASTVSDMWDAKVYALAILIAFFSGAWPYVKLAVMFVAWVTPPGLLTVARREKALIWLDILGKWSLIDFFVMVLMLCAFYFEMYMANENLLIKVTVLPKWGFYGFLLATMISLGLGHIILACHRLVTEHKVLPLPEAYSPKESLSSMSYPVTLEPEDTIMQELAVDRANIDSNSANSTAVITTTNTNAEAPKRTMFVKMTTFGTTMMVCSILLTSLFIIAGTFMHTMKFEFKGAVGWILRESAVVNYSFVSVGTTIPPHSGIPNDFAVRWMQISFFLFGVGMPLSLMLALLVLWVYPLSISAQRQLFVLAEVLNAWSTLDVYSISILAALLEIQQFAAFIVGDSCDGINKLLANFEEALDGDTKCFDVVALLLDNAWIIFTAAVLVILVGIPSLAICNMVIHTRMKQAEDGLNEHIRGHSMAVSVGSDSVHKKQRNSREYVPNSDNADIIAPLLPDNESGAVSPSVVETTQNNTSVVVAKKSYWQQMNSHNFNILVLRLLANAKMVTITTVDTNMIYHRQQLALKQESQVPVGSDFTVSDNNDNNNNNVLVTSPIAVR